MRLSGRYSFVVALVLVAGIDPGRTADMPVKARSVAAVPAPGLRFWAEAEYLYWQTKGDALPALVTTGGAGALGAPGTSVLFGKSIVNEQWRSGGRIRAGIWFDPRLTSGIEVHFFGLEDATTNFSAISDGTPLLARPFFNSALGVPNSLIIAAPGVSAGQINISETSRFWGAGAAYRQQLCSDCFAGPVFGLIGYRYLQLRENLDITTAQSVSNPLFTANFAVADQFSATNQFHGADLGLAGIVARGPWALEWRTTVALGATVTDISVNGSTTTAVAGFPATTDVGGLLALSSNIGARSQSRFSVVPELNARVVYQIAPQWRAYAGYSLIYWTNVVRPGGTIDATVNPGLIPPAAPGGPARPAPQSNTTDFWAQGVNFGVAFSY